jgi:D-amino-acid dehydrogenase
MPTKVLRYLFKSDAPIVFRPRFDFAQWLWLARWLSECRLERFRRNKARMQRLAFYSRDCLHALSQKYGFDYEQTQGYLQLFRTEAEVEQAAPARALLKEAAVAHVLLSAADCRRIEPAIVEGTPLAGGLHLPDDETGNCAFFAKRLKDICAEQDVQFRFGSAVERLEIDQGRIGRLRLGDGAIAIDAVVVAAGVDSVRLLRPLGIKLPLFPVKGYSATAAITRPENAPMIAVMDETFKVAVTRMGNRLRIAGTAEIGSHQLKLRDAALGTLLRVARDWFPGAAAYAQAQFWVGARPMLPDGPPVLGSTPIPNLHLNLGHGSTGWAMACGSARVVADLVARRKPDIDLNGLTLDRYLRPSA